MNKYRFQGFLCGLLTAAVFGAAAFAAVQMKEIAYDDIKVTYNGEEIALEEQPFIMEERTYLPIRGIAEALGLDVGWDGESKTVALTPKSPYAETIDIAIEMTDGSVIKAELYPDLAPLTVANFTKLIDEKFFDGLIFHRVIDGFMIQGGGYNEAYQAKESDTIKGEFSLNGVINGLSHTRGVLSMARTNIPDSASSQFFIVQTDSVFLDGQYAAFGRVTEGMDIVDRIAKEQTKMLDNGMEDVPVTPQVIRTISIVK